MGRDGEAGLGSGVGEIAELGARPAFEGGAVEAEAGALRRSGGQVSHGVESGVGVAAEFVEVALHAGIEVGVQRGLVGFFPIFRVLRQFWPADDCTDEREGLGVAGGIVAFQRKDDGKLAQVAFDGGRRRGMCL